MAREFGVSTMTVSKAVDLLERENHIHRVPGIGAFAGPASMKQSQGGLSPKVLALAAADLIGVFNTAVARGIGKACRARGWTLQIYDAHSDVQAETRNLLRVREDGLAGVFVMAFGESRHIASILNHQLVNFPVVLLDQTPAGLEADLVQSDHEAGAYLGVRHLLDHGHDCILMLSYAPVSSSVRERIRGYQRALREAGLEPRSDWQVWTDNDIHMAGSRDHRPWHGGCEAILPILRRARPPIGILAIDAYNQWGVYKACSKLGLRIPEDVSVVGFDDSEVAHAIDPPMTIIAQRTDEIGRAAVELLEQQIKGTRKAPAGRPANECKMIGVDLIKRQSVARVAGGGSVPIRQTTEPILVLDSSSR